MDHSAPKQSKTNLSKRTAVRETRSKRPAEVSKSSKTNGGDTKSQGFPFLALPRDLCVMIYEYAFKDCTYTYTNGPDDESPKISASQDYALLLASKQIYQDGYACRIYFQQSELVLDTPGIRKGASRISRGCFPAGLTQYCQTIRLGGRHIWNSNNFRFIAAFKSVRQVTLNHFTNGLVKIDDTFHQCETSQSFAGGAVSSYVTDHRHTGFLDLCEKRLARSMAKRDRSGAHKFLVHMFFPVTYKGQGYRSCHTQYLIDWQTKEITDVTCTSRRCSRYPEQCFFETARFEPVQ